MPSTKLAAALAELELRRIDPAAATAVDKARVMPVATAIHQRRAVERVKSSDRRAMRRHIKPENASVLLPALPCGAGESTHAIIAGDFIFCDLLAAIVAKRGFPRRLVIATLSLSEKNVNALAAMKESGAGELFILVSHYFEKTNKAIFAALAAVAARLQGFTVRVARSHCKVTLFDYSDSALVIEGSANLRSSKNLEQVSIFDDRELLEFHESWIAAAAASHKET